jgi:formylglycine-generating enzyme required for sulfatase activity
MALRFTAASGLAFCVFAGCGGGVSNGRGAKDITIYLVGLPVEMAFVQGGTLAMAAKCVPEQEGDDCGSGENHAQQVTLNDFYIGKHEVTQAQWRTIMGNNPSRFRGDSLPVDNVSPADIQTFLIHLNITTTKNFRLPTEAEWEYIAGGGGWDSSGSGRLSLRKSDFPGAHDFRLGFRLALSNP